MTRDLTWLRGFLHLDALQQQERISDTAIRLQEDTVLAALSILDREPGVLLADEVGMGKTYQALGLLACAFEIARGEDRKPHVLVVTPGPDLNHQWLRSAQTFQQKGFYGGFPKDTFHEVGHITELPDATARHRVVFAPINVFTSARGHAERGFLLDLWFTHLELAGPTRAAIRRRIEASGVQVCDGHHFLGRTAVDFGRLPTAAFKGERGGHAGLDDLYNSDGVDAFTNAWRVKKALDRVRFQLVRKVLPKFDLLIVDEAHKLKNPWTVQAQAVAQVLGGRFKGATFLTATPFQLGVEELRRVFDLFGCASEVRPGFPDDVNALFHSIADYQRTYEAFEEAWRFADSRQASAFAEWYACAAVAPLTADPRQAVPGLECIDDPNVATLARYVWELRRLKDHGVEHGFRRWAIRSLKPGKRERRHDRPLPIAPEEGAVVPLLMYQRLMTARARSGVRSHVEAAETSIASSFAAARKGAMVQEQGASDEAVAYQSVLQKLLVAADDVHPKVISVLETAMSAADKWEKSLLFCERNATIDSLHEEIEKRWMDRLHAQWERMYPGSDMEAVFGAGSGDERKVGIFQRWAMRFTRGQDELSVAFRESYPHTLFLRPDESALPLELWGDVSMLVADANDVLRSQRSSGTNATRLDYRMAGRCVDVAVARWFERRRTKVFGQYGGLPLRILDPSYPRLGIGLVEDAEEKDMAGATDLSIEWTLSEDTLRTLLAPSRRSIWFPFREQMTMWDATERVAIVEAVRTFFTRRQVPFVVDVLERAGRSEATSASFRDALEAWWTDPTCPWRRHLGEFLEYLPQLGKEERAEVLRYALPLGEFAARGNQGERRQKIQDAFNTPFFPMILVGNRTMQEGLNLQRQCRRVVHHDLRWNPADMEQRVGRVDRHGSLAERWLTETGGADGHILIDTPLLERTIDPSRYRRVKEREKWLDFLLGVPPEIGRGNLDESEVPPLPSALTEDLRVRLGPLVDGRSDIGRSPV
ncbi:SNF2-related protein [Methylocapsa acidiphila]|uniref:SNF2-related protein n=1 Tax=Methylocapsa acidiphila TaxID=133552 RepID=UPI00042147B4|nr:SNF2-related protein [Methylocapsa acidiphila]